MTVCTVNDGKLKTLGNGGDLQLDWVQSIQFI